ncbi:sodium-dependent bicarbonate transport family permease [Thioalkalivibrio sulfidiphilus]|uniref:sodium-dependent bicarbonate transport family permease n=1 Tax=Thioalkalivibrio sulfidiphilus TaxID=1033854 RepID=UPI003B2C6B48
MESNLLQNIIDPAILFFVFGVFAGAIRSNLEIPPAIAKFFSLYLLVAIGLKGGAALAAAGLPATGALALLGALIMATLVPAYSFLVLRRLMNPYDAAATAATYGSVSAVTFIAAQQFLNRNEVEFGGYMVVAMVLMESPAIIMAVLLATWVRGQQHRQPSPDANTAQTVSLKKVLHEAFTDGAHLLLIGSLLIGFVTGAEGKKIMEPFAVDIFKGILAFFLLEMGLLVARQLRESRQGLDRFAVGFALVMPVINAVLAMGLAWLFGLSRGDAMLLAVLAASASYIVVPAIVRYAIPEARPGVYFSMSLAVTFPFNLTVGIPLYYNMIGLIWSSKLT